MQFKKISFVEAYEIIKLKYKKARPNDGFKDQLSEYQNDLVKKGILNGKYYIESESD